MTGTNLKCEQCGKEDMSMAGSPPPVCCGVYMPMDEKRWWCPTHYVRYGGPRDTAKCPQCEATP